MTDNSPLGGETTTPLRLGTRRSKLAMAQSGMVADAVREVTGRAVELVEITTYGDVVPGAPGADRRDRRVRRRPARGAAARRGGLRRPLAEGPADHAARGPRPGRGADARGPARRTGGAGRADLRAAAARCPHRHRLAAPHGAAQRVRPLARPRDRDRADPRQHRHAHRVRAQRGAGRGGSRRRRAQPPRPHGRGHRASCRSTPSCPPPARGHWRSSALRAARTSPPRSPSSTTRTPGPP